MKESLGAEENQKASMESLSLCNKSAAPQPLCCFTTDSILSLPKSQLKVSFSLHFCSFSLFFNTPVFCVTDSDKNDA